MSFIDRLNMEGEREVSIMTQRIFGMKVWKYETSITDMAKNLGEAGMGEETRYSVVECYKYL